MLLIKLEKKIKLKKRVSEEDNELDYEEEEVKEQDDSNKNEEMKRGGENMNKGRLES